MISNLSITPYSGHHSTIIGQYERLWLDDGYVFIRFSENFETTRALYRSFVEKDIAEGRRDDLAGRRTHTKQQRLASYKGLRSPEGGCTHPGKHEFVLSVMEAAEQIWERTHAFKVSGVDFDLINSHVERLFNIYPVDILLPGKYPNRVEDRSMLCYFLIREPDMTATAVADRL
jgi:hypothetical protein